MSNLPTEILFKIFKLLPGIAIHTCRRVCTRWKDIVDDLSESDWKKICKRDHKFVEKTYSKGKLTYKELDKSLSLWPKIHSASVVYSKVRGKCFRLLSNGIVAVCIIDNNPCIHCRPPNECWEHTEKANTIVYYDIDSMKEIKRTTFQIFFKPDKYKENDKLIVLSDYERNYVVRIKTANPYDVLLYDRDVRASVCFYLNENKIFMIGRSQIHILDFIEFRIERKSYALKKLWGNVIAVNCIKNRLYVLTSAYLKVGQIRCLHNDEFRTVASFDRFRPHTFERFGFNWTDAEILNWLVNTYKEDMENITKFKIHAACRFGTTTLFVTPLHKAKIFLSLSRFEDGSLHFTRSTVIEYGERFPNLKYHFVEAIDAAETAKGPTVVCLLNDRTTVVAFEFRHKFNREGYSKQSSMDSDPSTSGLESKEPIDQFLTEPGASASGFPTENPKDPSLVDPGPYISGSKRKTPKEQFSTESEPSSSVETKKLKDEASAEPDLSAEERKDDSAMEVEQSASWLQIPKDQIEPRPSASGLQMQWPEDLFDSEPGQPSEEELDPKKTRKKEHLI